VRQLLRHRVVAPGAAIHLAGYQVSGSGFRV